VGDWTEFVAALTVFLFTHALPAKPSRRRGIVGLLGDRGYLTLYSAISLIVLVWLFSATGRAPFVPLWGFAPWRLWVPNLAMPLVCLLVAFGLSTPNPLSLGIRRVDRFDPERPGIVGVTRHPLLWAIALWAGAHVLPNGDLAHVLLFGSFGLFAVLGMLVIDRRGRRRLGEEQWSRLANRTSLVPFAQILAQRRWPQRVRLDAGPLLAAAMLYGALIFSHRAVIGISPFPVTWVL